MILAMRLLVFSTELTGLYGGALYNVSICKPA